MKKIGFKKILALTAWLAAIILMFVACSEDLDKTGIYIRPGNDAGTEKDYCRTNGGNPLYAGAGGAVQRCEIHNPLFSARRQWGASHGRRMLFTPNDRYPLDRTEFRLYYTSLGTDQQTIDVYIEDSFGQVAKRRSAGRMTAGTMMKTGNKTHSAGGRPVYTGCLLH